MANTAFKTYANEHGGRVLLLLLLFLLAIYQFVHAGFPAFAIICVLPILVLLVVAAFHYRMITFWALIVVNYFVQWKNFPSSAIPTSMFNEMLEIILIALALIDVKDSKFERCGNLMFLTLAMWCGFCTLEVLNDTCNIGIDVANWYAAARMMAFQLMYAFIVFTLYITTPKKLATYLLVWGCLALFSCFWVWKQKNIGLTVAEQAFMFGRGMRTHVLQGGALIRYFSTHSDAASFGIGIASTAVAFIIFGITAKVKKYKFFFLVTGIACVWAMFPSGTRTAVACLLAGLMTYIFLSKSFKIAIPFTIVFGLFVFILAFTNIGNGNQSIRRMRTAFDKNDASATFREANQAAMKKYMAEAPWGIGMAVGAKNVPANNKYTIMAMVPPDSEYVYIWIHTGVIGISFFLILTFLMLTGACWIVFFTLKSPSLRGIGAGLCCAFVSMQLGGYGNQVLTQFPNGLVTYGGLTIVYILPRIEKEWIEYENKIIMEQENKKRHRIEKMERISNVI